MFACRRNGGRSGHRGLTRPSAEQRRLDRRSHPRPQPGQRAGGITHKANKVLKQIMFIKFLAEAGDEQLHDRVFHYLQLSKEQSGTTKGRISKRKKVLETSQCFL